MKGELARRINEMHKQPSLIGIHVTGFTPQKGAPDLMGNIKHRHHRHANAQHKKHTFRSGEIAATIFRWNGYLGKKEKWDRI